MPVPGPVAHGQPAQRGGEKPGGERVPGADGGDDVDAEGGDVGDAVTGRGGAGVLSAARTFSPPRPFPNRGRCPRTPSPQSPDGLEISPSGD